MSDIHGDRARDRGNEILYHLKEIVEQESTLRVLIAELTAATDGEQRASLLSRIEVEVIDHLGYHLNELREPLADELSRVYEQLERSDT